MQHCKQIPPLGNVSGASSGVDADVQPIVIVCVLPYVVSNNHHAFVGGGCVKLQAARSYHH